MILDTRTIRPATVSGLRGIRNPGGSSEPAGVVDTLPDARYSLRAPPQQHRWRRRPRHATRTPMITRRLVASALAALTLTACPDADDNPSTQDDMGDGLSSEVCEAISVERECFAAGCDYFTNGAALTPVDDQCVRGASFGVCLYVPDDQPSDQLTAYTRTREGNIDTIQLPVRVEIPGWDACPSAQPSPPSCVCP